MRIRCDDLMANPGMLGTLTAAADGAGPLFTQSFHNHTKLNLVD